MGINDALKFVLCTAVSSAGTLKLFECILYIFQEILKISFKLLLNTACPSLVMSSMEKN